MTMTTATTTTTTTTTQRRRTVFPLTLGAPFVRKSLPRDTKEVGLRASEMALE